MRKKQKEPKITKAQVDALSEERRADYKKKSFVPLILQFTAWLLGFVAILIMFFAPTFTTKTVIVDSKNKEEKLYTISSSCSASGVISTQNDDELCELFTVTQSGIHSKSLDETVAYLQDKNYSSYYVAMYANSVILETCLSLEDTIPGTNNTYLGLAAVTSALGDDSAYEKIDAELENFGAFADYFFKEIGYLNIEGLEAFAAQYASYYSGTFYTTFSNYAEKDSDGNITYDYDKIKANIADSQLSAVEKWFTENAEEYLSQDYKFSIDLFADMDVCVGYADNYMVTMDLSDIFHAEDESGSRITDFSNYSSSDLLKLTISYGGSDLTYASVLDMMGGWLNAVLALGGVICFVVGIIMLLMAVVKKSPVNKPGDGSYAFGLIAAIFALVFNILKAAGMAGSEVVTISVTSSIVTAGLIVGIILIAAAIAVKTVCVKKIDGNNKEFFGETK